MLLSLNETQTPPPHTPVLSQVAMWVAIVALLPLGFGGCHKHDVVIMVPTDQFLKDRTGTQPGTL